MKYLLYLLPLLGALAMAQDPRCEDNCPQVKCPSEPVALCQCLNNREILCHERCPDYIPLIRPCPIAPPTTVLTRTSDPSATPTCECEDMFCAQSYPDSCYCANNNKKACFDKCGGAEPEYQVCETYQEPSSTMKTRLIPIPTPARTNQPCGGFRGNYQQCPPTEMCVKDPYRSGCGPACDQPGICVSQVRCSNRLGIPCLLPGQACVALPDCDPARGGQNCMGVCVYPH